MKTNPLKTAVGKKTASHNARLEDLKEAAGQEKTKRLNGNIPESLHRRVSIRAAEEGRSITSLMIDALEEYMSK